MFYYDSTFLLLIPALLLSIFAQYMVKGAYQSMSKKRASYQGTAAEAAQKILQDKGNYNVGIARVAGEMSDNYNPQTETLSLSDGVYNSNSIAALGIAAHEAGHAMQKFEGYSLLSMRTAIVPAVQLSSSLSMPLFVLGLVLSVKPLVTIGIAFFALAVIFSLITLPVEFDASRRAVAMLRGSNIIVNEEEMAGVKKVLRAAALTYVAAALMSLLQLLRLILISRSRDD